MYFTEKEFACKCGCGRAEMMPSTLAKLITARHMAKIPFHITSGFRCEAHNKAVGGKSEGAHTSGYAVDIEASTSPSRFVIVKHLMDAGFHRIGIGKTFIHADDDPSKPANVMWVY
jgi:hypothetical protein